MPLEVYLRGQVWYARGRVECEGRSITDYYRESTGASTEQAAREWCQTETERQRRRHFIGPEADKLTVNDAILEYDAKPADAGYLANILTKRPDVGVKYLDTITGKYLRNLGYDIHPDAATDTMWRQVVTPLRAAINNLHDLGRAPHIRVKAYTEKERIEQDTKRGTQSRVERKAGSKEWVEAFCAYADPYNDALVRFIFETAARIDQAVSLVRDDLDLMNHRVWIKAAKGHPAQWVTISRGMMIQLANLPPKQPHNRKTNRKLEHRVFGYADRGGYRKAWATICKKAGIELLPAHSVGRHGFYTELVVRQGVDPITAAKAGRWKDPALPNKTYGHAETNEADLRERFRTNPVHKKFDKTANTMKKKGK